jgi:hypothetical protein
MRYDHEVYSKRDRERIDKLDDQIYALEKRIAQLKQKQEEIACRTSPIQPGDLIEWMSGNRLRRGRVISVRKDYCGFEYRCNVVAKNGRILGFANVDTRREPTLITKKS